MDSERKKAAVEYLNQGYNGTQSIILSFSKDYGMENNAAMYIAEGFGNGMKTADTCSAITGGIMAIGLINAGISDAEERKKKTTGMVIRFKRNFEQKHGSTECRFLLGADITTPEGHKKAEDKGLFSKLCKVYVEDAVGILESINEE